MWFFNSTITATDIDSERLKLVDENCKRLQINNVTTLSADICKDHSNLSSSFDFILVDAPCSGSGVIRRHPDIKLLRNKQDIVKLAAQQLAIITSCWKLLKPGGQMIYSTCSILHAENSHVINKFLTQTADAKHIDIQLPLGNPQQFGITLLPNENQNDGFYICKIMKNTQQ